MPESLNLIDTHCHIQEPSYPEADLSLEEATKSGVTSCICVGTNLETSAQAVQFAKEHQDYKVYASVGIHPHEAGDPLSLNPRTWRELESLAAAPEVVAIGEFGFDFFYNSAGESLELQTRLAKKHLDLAAKLKLPIILHIREGFQPFLSLIEQYPEVRGVVHSFSDSPEVLEIVLALPNNFYISLNGIMTFTKDPRQLESAKMVPLDRLLLETDSPFLTPPPLRGKINSISNVKLVAKFLAELRQESPSCLAAATTKNAKKLFNI